MRKETYPEIVYNDNVTQYTNVEFANFSQRYNFRHITSLPQYHQYNGFAERMVGLCKKLLIKARESGTDCHLATMVYRATPISNRQQNYSTDEKTPGLQTAARR